MFSTLSQKTITSFFSKSNDPAKLPPLNNKKLLKKEEETHSGSSESKNNEDDSNSPKFKLKSKKRRILESDEDEDEDDREGKIAKSKCNEDSDSDRSTPKKKIRTYERSNNLRKREKKQVSESDSFSELENEENTLSKTKKTPQKIEDTPEKIEETAEKTLNTPEKIENTPEQIEKTSKKIGKTSKKIEKTSKQIESTPEKIEKTSEKIESTPEKIEKTSQKIESTPEKIENTPKKTINNFFAPKNEKMEKSGSSTTKGNSSEAIASDTYDPNDSKYDPIESAPWKRGEKVPYLALARTLEVIESVSSRLKMTEILANFFRSVIVLTPSDLLQCTYLCLNKLAPAYEGLELGVGDSVLMKAISQTTGRSIESIKVELGNKGDLGIIAEASRSSQRTMFKPARLTVKGVYDKLREIAKMSGHSSMTKKVEKIQSLLVACVQSEARYVIRSLGGKLRIGLAEQSLLAALAQAFTLTPIGQEYPPKILDASKKQSADAYKKELDENILILKTTYCECPCYDAIIPVLLEDGIKRLPEKCKITPGLPIKPMLAHPTKGVQEVLQRFENAKFTCEYKYDGERAQIHVLEGGEVQVYSRNQENNTSKYPDIIARIPKTLKKGMVSCILDTEAVAWDKENKQILPFQVLSTRKRKDATEDTIKVQVCIFAFDLLYYNGESLVMKPFQERRSLLHSTFEEIEGEFVFVTSIDSNNVDDIGVFLEEAVKNKCEGLMVKTLDVDATYEIAKRSHNWLKLKKDYLDGVGDTLDLVVIGCYHGKGKRAGTYGGFLLACYDPDNEEFQTICKLGTGFKDEDLAQHTAFLKQHVLPTPKPYYRFDSSLEPDEWVDAVQVWEVKCADLSISPVHKAGVGVIDPQKGISLRFPRFIRIRDDKNPEDATSASQVVSLYENQEQIKNQQKGPKSGKQEDEEDFY